MSTGGCGTRRQQSADRLRILLQNGLPKPKPMTASPRTLSIAQVGVSKIIARREDRGKERPS